MLIMDDCKLSTSPVFRLVNTSKRLMSQLADVNTQSRVGQSSFVHVHTNEVDGNDIKSALLEETHDCLQQ